VGGVYLLCLCVIAGSSLCLVIQSTGKLVAFLHKIPCRTCTSPQILKCSTTHPLALLSASSWKGFLDPLFSAGYSSVKRPTSVDRKTNMHNRLEYRPTIILTFFRRQYGPTCASIYFFSNTDWAQSVLLVIYNTVYLRAWKSDADHFLSATRHQPNDSCSHDTRTGGLTS